MKTVVKLLLVTAAVVAMDWAGADTETVNGVTWTYKVENGKASVGNGTPEDPAVPRSTVGEIEVPATLGGYPVTSIGSYAFYGCSGLTSVMIPDSVTDIGDSAFDECGGLTNVTIGNSVTSLGSYAFFGCSDLTNVAIPDGVEAIASTAFNGCEKLWAKWFKTLERLSANEAAGAAVVALAVTNVVVHYIKESAPSEAVTVPTDTGIVNIISEVNAGAAVAIASDWAAQYAGFEAKFGSDFAAALTKPTGKRDGSGRAMQVWQDYVAGTDPTKEDDVFRASITFDAEGRPQIAYSPKFTDAAEAAKRRYRTFGKVRLQDKEWAEVPDGAEGDYNFFKVTVEMR